MYDDHYGLSGRPFQLTPDPRFWFDTATHRKAMAYLGYGLAQGEGFIVITGDVGAGKTTLVGHLMATVDRERLHVIKIVSTQIEADDLLRLVAGGLSVDAAGMTKAQLLTAIERGLHATARSGRRTLLIVDEAQALPVGALEELRMLSNFQASGHALLQIFLLGQPEFRQRLHGSDRLEQLRQRVIAMHHLDPMGPEEVQAYMTHRLGVVGWQGNPEFTPDAYRAIHRGSDGVPRRLNQLAGRVLLSGAIEQLEVIDAVVVDAVIADIAGDMPVRVATVEPVEPVSIEAEVSQPDTFPGEGRGPVAAKEVTSRCAEPVSSSDCAPAFVGEGPEVEEGEEQTGESEPEPIAEASKPLPIFHVPPPSEPRPIRLMRDIDPPFVAPPLSVVSEPEATEPAASELAAPSPEDQALTDRMTSLEARIEEQEAALRRVLTLLVDWVEGEGSPDIASLRHAAGH